MLSAKLKGLPKALLVSTWAAMMVSGCGATSDTPLDDELNPPFTPSNYRENDATGSKRKNPYGSNDTGKADVPPRNYGDGGNTNVDGDTVKPDPPPADPGDPGDPIPPPPPGPPPPVPPPPQPTPPEDPVPTPSQFEGVWTFYQYCVIAEDRVEAMNYANMFENILHFEAWLADIQVTVAAIRVRLPYPRDNRIPQKNCLDAYNLFKEKVVFSLAPDPEKNERFEIVNIDPISGLPNLRGLNLRDNKIVDMTFLRNLTALRFLDLSINRIKVIPKLRRSVKVGLINLEELGIEYQNEEFTPLDVTGVAQLYNVRSFKMMRLKSNIVDPSNLRFFTEDFQVSTTRVLQFQIGSESCEALKWGFSYPPQLEEKRVIHCGAR